ncbi:hypothetical protein [Bradyrhizobium elkanii]|uniref:hypothetical protein n=1 Tax=Bradyrhizobium elkanii TaxID=29448 RepID=UPI0035115642
MSWVIGHGILCRLEGSGRTASGLISIVAIEGPQSYHEMMHGHQQCGGLPHGSRATTSDLAGTKFERCAACAAWVYHSAGCCRADDSTQLLLICASSNSPVRRLSDVVTAHSEASSFVDIAVSALWNVIHRTQLPGAGAWSVHLAAFERGRWQRQANTIGTPPLVIGHLHPG